ncbi:MAG: hypothetical protein AAGC55_25795, partial [Myxococcota bacterium]
MSNLPEPETVGQEIIYPVATPALPSAAGNIEQLSAAWTQQINLPGATYIAPHFSHFDLPDGAYLIVRSPDGSRSRTYTGQGKEMPESTSGFWGIHIDGDTAVLELFTRVAVADGAIAIDKVASGLVPLEALTARAGQPPMEAICGSDDSDWAKCYESSESEIYDRSRAVARLLINGVSACTGWLVGSEGHLMTNEHCIGSQAALPSIDFEFMAEGPNCATDCSSALACPGTIEASSGTMIQVDGPLDYALLIPDTSVASNTDLPATYGFMRLRVTKVDKEEIVATVLRDGELVSRAGINLPGIKVREQIPTA